MDIDIQDVLRATLDPNGGVRSKGEAKLREWETKAVGPLLGVLLTLVADGAAAGSLRQAAAIRVKHLIQREWSVEKHGLPKAELRLKVFELVCNTLNASAFNKMLQDGFMAILRKDFPQHWPDLVPFLQRLLGSPDTSPAHRLGAAMTARLLFKSIRYQSRSEDVARELARLLLPVLLDCAAAQLQILEQPHESISSDLVSLSICTEASKAFYLSVSRKLPPCFLEGTRIDPWVHLLIKLFELTGSAPDNENCLIQQARRCEKWSARSLRTLFVRYGRPAFAGPGAMREFAVRFLNDGAALSICGTFLERMHRFVNGAVVSRPVLFSLFNYMVHAICHAALFQALRPHLPLIITGAIFRALCITPEELEEWNIDPSGYLGRQMDSAEEGDDPRMSAARLLAELVRIRTSDTLNLCIEFFTNVLQQTSTEQNETEARLRKDGVLHMLGYLSAFLSVNVEARPWVEHILLTQVAPELGGPSSMMRLRAVWFVGRFVEVPLVNVHLRQQLVLNTLTALRDPDVPVKVEACNSVARILQCQEVYAFVRSRVSDVLRDCMELIDEVGNEQVMSVLELIIMRFGDDITPFAVDMCKGLVDIFQRHAETSEEVEAMILAASTMRAINVLLYSVKSIPQLLLQLEVIVYPLMTLALSENGAELYDEAMEMVSLFTQKSPSISETMWKLLPAILQSQTTSSVYACADIVHPMKQFITRGRDHFFASTKPSFVELTISACASIYNAFAKSVISEECKYANRVLEVLLICGEGRMDAYLLPVIQLVSSRLWQVQVACSQDNDPEASLHRMLLLHLIGLCAYNGGNAFFAACESLGCTEPLLSMWLTYAPTFQDTMLRSVALGVASLLRVPFGNMPPIFSSQLNQILTLEVQILSNVEEELKELELERELLVSEQSAVDENQSAEASSTPCVDDASILRDIPANNDFVDEDELTYLRVLGSMNSATTSVMCDRIRSSFFSVDDDGDGEEEPDAEEPLVCCIDCFQYFSATVQHLSTSNPQHFETWKRSLDPRMLDSVSHLLRMTLPKSLPALPS